MISALLLANAGVETDDIVADYATSVRAMAGTASHGGSVGDRQAAWTAEQVEGWLRDVVPHVRDFVANPAAMLDAIGVRRDTRSALRDLLTVPR